MLQVCLMHLNSQSGLSAVPGPWKRWLVISNHKSQEYIMPGNTSCRAQRSAQKKRKHCWKEMQTLLKNKVFWLKFSTQQDMHSHLESRWLTIILSGSATPACTRINYCPLFTLRPADPCVLRRWTPYRLAFKWNTTIKAIKELNGVDVLLFPFKTFPTFFFLFLFFFLCDSILMSFSCWVTQEQGWLVSGGFSSASVCPGWVPYSEQ